MDTKAGPIVLERLFGPQADYNLLPWEPFREGVDIVRIYGRPYNGPAAALLRYRPGATIPQHRHTGYEHILVLSASQSDERGEYHAGTLVVQPPGTTHRVASSRGCVVLIIWEKPVVVEEPAAPTKCVTSPARP